MIPCIAVLHCWCFLLCGGVTSARECSNELAVDRLVRAMNGESSAAIRKEVRQHFDAATQQEIIELTTHADDRVALQAKWELIRRSLQEKPGDLHEAAQKIDRRQLQRFVGFVEGRLRLQLPEWWSRRFARLSFFNRNILAVPDRLGNLGLPYRATASGLLAPHGIEAVQINKDLIVSIGEKRLRVPPQLVDREAGFLSAEWVSAVLAKDRCFLEFHSLGCGKYTLWCLDRKNASIVWSRDVLVGYPHVAAGSVTPMHWATLTLSGDRVFVFGACETTMYIQAFSVDDGTPLLRFSTAH